MDAALALLRGSVVAAGILERFNSSLTTVLPFLVLIGALILVHEWGHYIVARWVGMKVEEFWVGFPFPPVKTWKRNGTIFGIGLIPLGGYVKILGMNPEDPPHPEGFNSKPLWARIAVLLAGCTMNVILGAIVFAAVLIIKGVPLQAVVIESVSHRRPAERAGFLSGDHIKAINGKPILGQYHASVLIQGSKGRPLRISIERQGEDMVISVRPRRMKLPRHDTNKMIETYGIGISFVEDVYAFRRIGMVEGIQQAAFMTYKTAEQIVFFLKEIFVRPQQTFQQMGGPVRIMKDTGRQTKAGLAVFFLMLATLSMNLAVLNLFPFPALDGGRILLIIYNRLHARLFGRPIDPRREFWVHAAGLAFLLFFMLVVSARDLGQWIGGG